MSIRTYASFCCATLLLVGCSQSAPPLPAEQLLTPGGLYSYEWSITADDDEEPNWASSFDLRLMLARGTESIGDLEDLYRLDGERLDTGDRSSAWYQQRHDGLYEVAYERGVGYGGFGHPRPTRLPMSPTFEAVWHEVSFLGAAGGDEGPVVRDPARLLYPNRLQEGTEWEEFDLGFLRRISRVDAIADVTTEAGTFRAYVIKTDIEASQEPGEYLRAMSYVVPGRGMVLRVLEGRFLGRDVYNLPTGWFTSIERVEMVDR